MDAVTVLDEIERIAGSLVNLPQCERPERVHAFTTIRVLIQELEEFASLGQDSNDTMEVLKKLKWSCRAIAGLDPGGGNSEGQHLSWIRQIVKELKVKYGEKQAKS